MPLNADVLLEKYDGQPVPTLTPEPTKTEPPAKMLYMGPQNCA